MSNNPFLDVALNNDDAVRTLVTQEQAKFQKTHGSAAVALIVATGYVNIRKIRYNASADVQAALLDEHGVAEATGTTSKYTPWIKVQWGEPHANESKTFKDSRGEVRRQWVPDRSMEIYQHTMEELQDLGVETHDVKKVRDVILKHGGASKMARDRQKALNARNKPLVEQVIKQKRELFLEETTGTLVELPLVRPENAGEFWTLVVRATPESSEFEVLGVVSHNAASSLDQLASDQYEALKKQVVDREREAKHQRDLEACREANAERVFGAMTPEERRAMFERMRNQAQSRAATAPVETAPANNTAA